METRANYALIGIFTIAVIGAAFGFVFWFAGTESGTDRPTYRIQFQGTVAGLAKGSPVLFNGIRVGDVTTVDLIEAQPDQAYATVQVAKTTPIRADTRASLDVNLLSGVAQVALTGGSADAPQIEKLNAADPYPTIIAEPGGLGNIIQTAKGAVERANLLLDAVNSVVTENRGSITRSVRNVESVTEALAKNAPAIEGALASIADAARRVGPLAVKLETLTDETTTRIRAVEPERVQAIVRNVASITQTVEDSRAAIAGIFREGAGLMTRLNEAGPKIEGAVASLDKILAGIDPGKVREAIDSTQRFTAGLAASTPDLQATMRNASSLTAKFDQAASRVDGVLKAAEDFLGSAAGQEGKSTFASIRDAMDRFGRASDNLNRRATEIAQGVSRFSGVGARQLEALGTDARRTVNTIGRAAGNLERNPSSVIFGTGRASIPDYTGR